jgi:tRNA1Val (adenine37-N6)-methyltransferase
VLEADARELANSTPLLAGSQLFDAILCNPPFFENSLKCPDSARTMARHTDTLSFDELARSASRLLASDGELSVVIPYDRARDMTVSAACYGLFATRQTIVVPVEGGKPKRMLMAFSREGAAHEVETLCLNDAQRKYTPEYVSLVEDFYLKM